MNSRTFILRETFFLLLGELLCSAAIVGIYALLGKLEAGVIWGVLIGTILGTGNFFMLGVSADAAATKAQEQDVKGGKQLMRLSYQFRLIVLFVLLFVFAKSGLCSPLAMVLPLLLFRPLLMVIEFLRKPGEKE
ncbi:MAG: hypothetical protein IKU70_06935 [Clostridia bacterium]|nr:hypothetical protein [Clostridia bacterium]